MNNTLRLCNIRKYGITDRYIFVDEDNIHYFWDLGFSEYGIDIEIFAFKKYKDTFIEIKTPKVQQLIEYLKFRLLDKTPKEIEDFFVNLSSLQWKRFSVPYITEKKLGKEFCDRYFRDRDAEFILLDPNAKHRMIDFDKIKKKERDFIKEPTVFPFVIPEVHVIVTNEGELIKDGKTITLKEFEEAYKEYKKALIPTIKRKNKIMRKIEEDLRKRTFESLDELKRKKISDYEIEAKVEVYDGLLSYEPILTVDYPEFTMGRGEYSLCSLKHAPYEIDIEICYLFWRVIDTFGLRAVETKFTYWSEIKKHNQKFFTV